MTEHRWSKFWWQDWQSDPALRSCSLAARGLWMDMLCIAHSGTPRGHVNINGQTVTTKRLATLAGTTEKECAKLLAEMEEAGVFSRDDTGTIYSRRMVRDTEIADVGREAVGRRWKKRDEPISPPNRSDDEDEAKLIVTKSHSQKCNTPSGGEKSVDNSAQPIGNIDDIPAQPITPPNRPPMGDPNTLEAESRKKEREDIDNSFPMPREAYAEAAAPEAAPSWPPDPHPSAVTCVVGQLTARLEGRAKGTRMPAPQKPVRTVDEQLAALVPGVVRLNRLTDEQLAEARAALPTARRGVAP